MSKKISAVYKITNTATGDFYIGSSKDIKRRWAAHKWPSVWNRYPNKQLYQDMKKYGADKFDFEILAEVEIDSLKEKEQEFIELLKPTYNSCNASGRNFERYKECKKEYQKSHRESHIKSQNKYDNKICSFNGETLTLCALAARFRRAGIPHPTLEAKKYLI